MGNITSCSCSCISSTSVSVGFLKKRGNMTKTAMVVDTSGNIREVKLPVKSGELMIEEIGHVITPADELRRTRRVSALAADEELVAGKVYLLVPASRVHSKASALEMAIAEEEEECGQWTKKTSANMAKVSPSPVSKLRDEWDDGENEVGILPVCPRMGNQRRWNPALDPILESSREFTQQL